MDSILAGQLALVVSAIFAGAAFYIHVAEQPARLGLDDRALLKQWKAAYPRGYAMQAPLAVLGCLLGAWAWYGTGRAPFLIGAFLMIANWPWTILVIRRVNKILMETAVEDAGAQSRALIVKWNLLHSVRTVMGGFAVLAYLCGLSCK